MLSGLARRLVRDQYLDENSASEAIAAAMRDRIPLPVYLAGQGLIPSSKIAHSASEEFGTPLFDLAVLSEGNFPKGIVDTKLIQKHFALPVFNRGNRLYIAVSDPTNLHALDEIKFNTGLSTEALLVEADKLQAAIEHYRLQRSQLLSPLSG